MGKQTEDRRDSRAPRGAGLLRLFYGTGLLALGACLGIVIGSLSETPRLLLERLRGPVETVDVAVPEPEAAKPPTEAGRLERFGDLQEGRAPKAPRAVPKAAKPEVEAEPPPLVPAAELEPAPAVAAAPPAASKSGPAPAPAAKPEAAQPHGAVVQVASYVERKPADDLVRKLESSGFSAYVSQPATTAGRFRVRIRPGAGESVGQLATRLRGFGFDTWATSE